MRHRSVARTVPWHVCVFSGIGKQDKDDIHIIFEYDKGAVWGNMTTPRANR